MVHHFIDKRFYESVCNFEKSEEAKDYYYQIMQKSTGRLEKDGREEKLRDQILKAYAMLFCESMNLKPGTPAGPDEVEATADRLFIGKTGFDPQHWYRMRYHFPVIDDDNYDRFAALVIADLKAGPLRQAVLEGGDMLLVGEADPLHMTREQRMNQKLKPVKLNS